MKREDRAGRAKEVSSVMKREMSDRMGEMERKTKWGEVRGEGPVIEEGVLGTLCTGDQYNFKCFFFSLFLGDWSARVVSIQGGLASWKRFQCPCTRTDNAKPPHSCKSPI